MGLLLTGCNENTECMEMRKVCVASIKRNDPDQDLKEVTFPTGDRIEAAMGRVKLFHQAFQRGWTRVGWVDVDTIVRAPLDDFWSDVEPGTLKVMYRPGIADCSIFNTGVMAIGRSPETEELVANWLRGVMKAKKWLDDQRYLWKVWKKSVVRLIPLETKFNDNHFDRESVIWHGKGHSREDSRWIREAKKYA